MATGWKQIKMERNVALQVQKARGRRAVSIVEAEYGWDSFDMRVQRSWLVVGRLAVSSSWPGWIKVK